MLLAWNLIFASGCVAQLFKNFITSSHSCCVALDWRPTTEPRVCAMVRSVAREYQANVPTMSCTYRIPSGGRSGKLLSGVGACTVAL